MDNKVGTTGVTKDKKALLLKIAVISIPFLQAMMLVLFFSLKYGEFVTPGVLWNDEGSYNALIKTYAAFGSSPGYYGFNGEHAIWGTGSGWSPALIWPFSIPAMVLPVGISYVFWMNIFYLTVANLLFVVLTKPRIRESVYLILIQLLSAVPVLYLSTNMSEIFRFALAIVIAGLLINMAGENRSKIVAYILAPIVILYSVFAYIFFVFAVPIYVYLLLKERKKIMAAILSVASLFVVGGGTYALIHFIICNYNIGKTEKLFEHLSSGEVLTAAIDVCKMAKDGLMEIVYLKNYIGVNPIYPMHTIILIALLAIGVVILWIGIAKGEIEINRYIGGSVALAVFLFTAGYATLYTIVPDTFLRGIEIVVIFACFMLTKTNKSWAKWLVIGLCAVEILTFPKAIKSFTPEERFVTKEVKNTWKGLADKFDEVIEYRKDGTKWENTVIMYTTEPRAVYALPVGMGINYSLTHDTVCTEAGYLFFTLRKDGKPEWVDTDYDTFMNDHGDEIYDCYEVVYDDGEYIIYRRSDI